MHNDSSGSVKYILAFMVSITIAALAMASMAVIAPLSGAAPANGLLTILVVGNAVLCAFGIVCAVAAVVLDFVRTAK